ncbi:hypothetical protein Leryth_015428 [Lithospermum erythrorhizon]|nr:hypothetical protein Leryth_015428 [Lithospermum erythrorhizon]
MDQATLQGFEAKGLSREEAEALLKRSVEIAIEARDIFNYRASKGSWDFIDDVSAASQRPVLVAASVGSYGAYLSDGSEYSGIYPDNVSIDTLKDFHRRRVQAYVELLEDENIKIPAWLSFSCKDGINVVSGDLITDCAKVADSCRKVIGVGINCTSPRYIHDLIQSIQKVTDKPILVYPNSGETYVPETKEWVKSNGVQDEDFVAYIGKWYEAGASLIGGCCRTTPNTIRAISRALSSKSIDKRQF